MNKIKTKLDFALVLAVIGGFVAVAAERLGTVPVYETDESYILQVAYEILHRGKLALPMYRYLDGNIQNVWHSFTPLYFFSLSGFLKVFGFGVLQARAFNLIAVVCCLVMVYLIGRRLFNWPAGLIAVVLIISDPTVLQRARMVRNDYLAEAFGLLALYLYEIAEDRKSSRYYVTAGLAAGAGVMCHPSIIYMGLTIALLMLIRSGRKVFANRSLYQFAFGVLAVCGYEIVYDVIDYKNVLLQYRSDNLHFSILSVSGLWSNFLDEPSRYVRWYRIYDVTFQSAAVGLLHLFQFLIPVALIYLAVRAVRAYRLRLGIREPRVRLLLVTAVAVLFAAFILHKAGYYNIHVITWFSLCVGVLLADTLGAIWRLAGSARSPEAARTAAACLTVVLIISYSDLLGRQYKQYLTETRSPDNASSAEFNGVLASVIPAGLCPVAVMAPVLWLAFPDLDQCFATIERRMAEQVRIDGRDYALIMRPKASEHWAWELSSNRHLLAELIETPYGNFNVYYTGTNQSLLPSPPSRYYFFRQWNGHASQEQVDAARTIWSDGQDDFTDPAINEDARDGGHVTTQSNPRGPALPLNIALKARTIYSIRLNGASALAGWELLVTEARTGRWLRQIPFVEKNGESIAADLFRTLAEDTITLRLHEPGNELDESLQCISAQIKEVATIETRR